MEISEMTRSTQSLLVAWAAGVFVACASAPAFGQYKSPRPMQRAAEEYFALLMSSKFDALEQAANEARRTGATLSDGQPRLAAIYAAAAGDSSIRLTDDLWKIRRQRLQEWQAHLPGSITAKVALASFPMAYGWFARGSGYSSTVSQDGFALLRERTEEARRALESLDAAAKADPGWANTMLDVALNQHWPSERYDALYEAAVAKYPDYLPLHFALAQYYSARWHGSAEEQRRAVERVVERTRAKMGETMYARLNWGLQTNEMFRNGQTEWTRMKSGFERMTKDYPDAWNINHYARFACQAEDWATVSRLAATIGEEPIVTAWRGTADYYRACRDAARHMAPKS